MRSKEREPSRLDGSISRGSTPSKKQYITAQQRDKVRELLDEFSESLTRLSWRLETSEAQIIEVNKNLEQQRLELAQLQKREKHIRSELDDIFSAQNLMHPAYKAKRYTDESEQ